MFCYACYTVFCSVLSGFGSLFPSGERIRKLAIVLQPSTLLKFHDALVRLKYRRLFSSSHRPKKPGPKGLSDELIRAIVELKSRNPRFGCPRIARNISRTFGIEIDQNIVCRLAGRGPRGSPSSVTRRMACGVRSLSLRIVGAQFVLGAGHHGSVQASRSRVRHSLR